MATDLLRVQSNERVDADDLSFAVQQSIEDNARHVATHALCDPDGQAAWILSGFALSNPSGSLLQVARGVALLPRRDGARIVEGLLTSEGEASKTLDLGGYAAVTHGIYVQFVYQDADTQSRTFWNPSTEKEYSQAIEVRKQAAWDVRVEQVSPGADWFKIGEVLPSTMAITDQRDFFFEGLVSDSYAADGWGSGNDRNSNRALYGVTNVQQFTEAIRTIVEELRSSSGNRRWWEAGVRDLDLDVGPLRVGFVGGTPPSVRSVMVGDVNFHMDFAPGGDPTLAFDDTDFLWYDRAGNQWNFEVGGVGLLGLSPTLGLWVSAPAAAPRLTWASTDFIEYDTASNFWAWKIASSVTAALYADGLQVTQGLRVGFTGTPLGGNSAIELFDEINVISGTVLGLKFKFGSNDYLQLVRDTTESLRLTFDTSVEMRIDAGVGMYLEHGLRVGSAVLPSAPRLEIDDQNFALTLNGATVEIHVDEANGDFMSFNRSADLWRWALASATRMQLANVGGQGALSLRDSGAALQTVNGDAFKMLADFAVSKPGVSAADLHNFVVEGLALCYDGAAVSSVGLGVGVACINGQWLYKTSDSTIDLTVDASWVSGTKPVIDTPPSFWVFCFMDTDKALKASRYPPQGNTGRLHDSETPGGGKTRQDYLYVGAVQYRNETGLQLVSPFARSGDLVFLEPLFSGYYADALAMTDASTAADSNTPVYDTLGAFDNYNQFFPSVGAWPYTTASAILMRAVLEATNDAVAQSFRVAHGFDTGARAAQLEAHGQAAGMMAHSEGPFPVRFRRVGTQFTLCYYSLDLQAAGSRNAYLEGVGYVEQINRGMSYNYKP